MVKGAFVDLPRWFADTGKVQDWESRLVTCMSTLQGIDPKAIVNGDWGRGERANTTALATWIAAQSKGMPFNLSQSYPLERTMYEVGKRLFFQRGGGTFCVSEPINGEPAGAGNGATIGFKCASAEQVSAFHDTAVAQGGVSIEDPPGLREGKLGAMYLAYVRDPDGNKLCAIYRPKPA